jgi:hypothetical protein
VGGQGQANTRWYRHAMMIAYITPNANSHASHTFHQPHHRSTSRPDSKDRCTPRLQLAVARHATALVRPPHAAAVAQSVSRQPPAASRHQPLAAAAQRLYASTWLAQSSGSCGRRAALSGPGAAAGAAGRRGSARHARA